LTPGRGCRSWWMRFCDTHELEVVGLCFFDLPARLSLPSSHNAQTRGGPPSPAAGMYKDIKNKKILVEKKGREVLRRGRADSIGMPVCQFRNKLPKGFRKGCPSYRPPDCSTIPSGFFCCFFSAPPQKTCPMLHLPASASKQNSPCMFLLHYFPVVSDRFAL
jgi:hypothetical protein